MNKSETYISQQRIKNRFLVDLNPEGVTWLSVPLNVPKEFLKEP